MEIARELDHGHISVLDKVYALEPAFVLLLHKLFVKDIEPVAGMTHVDAANDVTIRVSCVLTLWLKDHVDV